MTTEGEVPVEERILQLLHHLGIRQAHFAASNIGDWRGLAKYHSEVISSLTLVSPRAIDPSVLGPLAPRLLVFNGDQGSSAAALQRSMTSLPDATLVTLPDYLSSNTADIVADRSESVGSALMDFLRSRDPEQEANPISQSEGRGEVAGISYSIRGSGPPLLLFPIEYAASRWDTLLPTLSQHYSTVTLGGAWLGAVAILEARSNAPGYLRVIGNLLDEVQLKPGETLLDVGCGSGGLNRWLAHRTSKANPIIGADISPFLLREATALASKEGLTDVIEYQEGDAEALPFPDACFNITTSTTVMERVDADRMLEEMIRVTKPGGRVAVLVQATDRSRLVNLPLGAELKAKVETNRGLPGRERGCADASLYRRFHQAGLGQVKMLPQLAVFGREHMASLQDNLLATLNREEEEDWRAAVIQVEAEGTFFIADPFHCAVGTKPQ